MMQGMITVDDHLFRGMRVCSLTGSSPGDPRQPPFVIGGYKSNLRSLERGRRPHGAVRFIFQAVRTALTV